MQLADIKKLAEISRVDMAEEEMQGILDTFPSILSYIDQINELAPQTTESVFHETNVFRDDLATNQSGEYTENIITQFPDTQDGYLKVKQIL